VSTPPPRVFHLTTPEAWSAAEATGQLVPDGYASEGFVHCSTLEQLVGTIERHFAGVDELRLLELDGEAVAGGLRWEESRPGEVYPHLYRPLHRADVSAVWSWRRREDGTVRLPAGLD